MKKLIAVLSFVAMEFLSAYADGGAAIAPKFLWEAAKPFDGEVIPIPERIGILDRKLRIVTENVGAKPKEWLKHACIVVFRQRKNPNLFKDICAAA